MATFFRSDGWVKSVLGQAVAGAQVYVCSQPADVSYVPPLPQVPLFADAAGATPLAQPVITDGFGHYGFYVPYGTYTVVIVNGGNIQQVYTDQTIGFTSSAQAVSSVFGRTGAVAAQSGDYSVAQITGAAPLSSPAFTGIPTAPTASNGTNTTQLATCAFVLANVGGGAVSSVFGRTGAVVATSGDYDVSKITGAAPLSSPTFTGTAQMANAYITGTLKDGTASVGTSGQVLSSTVTGTKWIAAASGGGGAFPFQTIVPPGNIASWANKQDPGSSGTFIDLTGAVMIACPAYSGSTNNLHALYNAAPGVPFTLTAAFYANIGYSNYPSCAIFVMDSGGKYTPFGVTNGAWQANGSWVGGWASFTSQGGDRKSPYNWPLPQALYWFQIKYDGVNLIYSLSQNGSDWIVQLSESATAYLSGAPAYIGFGVQAYQNNNPAIITLVSWNVTTP